ncbi:multidrug and toxin extrusion protein 2-like isoform X2 [Callorhinchus milii]|uniref:multidrug and toxin extrusion protein 2-like isoform X2 n=1 Tax=Callorhinchus milii TaxID=7868 RepID=UPI001C3FD0EA|nr:multidrug and toxin extrusion protein 2-like isoform X2 [Callorhinchus milii]
MYCKILSQVLLFTLNFISAVFSGHLGKLELNAVTLATSVISVTGIAVGMGLSMACDTMMSQMYGGRNLKQIGVILQRGILILMMFCFPCWALFINTDKILLAVKQDPEVSRLCQLYVKIFIPAIPALFLYQLQIRYLQNQEIVKPQVLTGLVTNILSVLMHYIFLFVLKLEVAGCAWANVIVQYCQIIVLFIYIRWKNLHLSTWAGWTTECLQEWGPFFQLAIPSLLMFCMELWAYEIGSFLAGLISQVELGAQSVIFQVLTIFILIHIGIGSAAGIRVGMALGGGNPHQAKTSAVTALFCTGCIALLLITILGVLKDYVAKLFTNDRQIGELVSKIIPIIAPFHLFDALSSGVGSGIVRGIGKQKIGAIANLVAFYVIGLPIGISLMFAAKCGILGFWSGLAISSFLLTVFLLTLIFRLNWNAVVEEAQERAALGKMKEVSTDSHFDATAHELTDSYDQGSASTQTLNEGNQQECTTLITKEDCCPSGEVLSTRQLIVRRGLALLAGLVVLALGVVVHFYDQM